MAEGEPVRALAYNIGLRAMVCKRIITVYNSLLLYVIYPALPAEKERNENEEI